MPIFSSITTSRHEIELSADDLFGFSPEVKAEAVTEGLDMIKVSITSERPGKPPTIELRFAQPALDVCGTWAPNVSRGREIRPDWAAHFRSNAMNSAPVAGLFGPDDRNRLTVACDDALNSIDIRLGLEEETGMIVATVRTMVEPHSSIGYYCLAVRIDVRPVLFTESLRQVSSWWETLAGYTPAPVPNAARQPMYSTWYSFHQSLDVDEVVKECRRSRALGSEAVIVDDGWQTLDASRGYAYCGDWESDRIEDMASFVSRVHDVGMKFLLWYSVPFVGTHSKVFGRFKDKALRMEEKHSAIVLDPRFPDVREYLISLYERHLREWNLDGFKLDFVDAFRAGADNSISGNGRDYASVYEAVDRLLSDTILRLSRIRADVMVEFRQSYVGPLMRKYGNMFRAGDCPGDYITNRTRTVDIRLLCGNTAVHSDMIMWHPQESTERAALQLLNVLFSVPQISIRLDRISEAHTRMLKFWLGFWRQHREVLLDGSFQPHGMAANYSTISCERNGELIIAQYSNTIAKLSAAREIYIVNATASGRVVVEATDEMGECMIESFDCEGTASVAERQYIATGLVSLPVWPSGLIHIKRCRKKPALVAFS